MKYIKMLAIIFAANLAYSQNTIEYEFLVQGECGMCQDRIEETAVKAGAESASWDMATKILTVDIDESKVSVSDIRYAIAQAGHDNGNFKAPKDIYDDLPGCCQYRPEEVDDPDTNIDLQNKHHQDSEDVIEGFVYGYDQDGRKMALIGATVSLEHGEAGTTTDFDGYFVLENEHGHKTIQISYVGYETQTVEISEDGMVEVYLADGHVLDQIEIKYKKKTTEVSYVKTLNVESISRNELRKAACCNLSESFETNPSVDVSFSDAITGLRQIQMLGLAGPYVQLSRELMPDVRAMSSLYGLTFTPGPWVESIQLIKGAGSVVNGFESMTGQINVELKKPEIGENLHVNGYANEGSRIELNLNTRKQITDKLSTAILLHGKNMSHGQDRNDDGFLDMPLEKDFIAINRWKWYADNGWEGQFGVKATVLDHKGGSFDHFEGSSTNHEDHWRFFQKLNRYEVWNKTGIVFPNAPTKSIGVQLSAVYHDADGEFGFARYDNTQKSLYANTIFQNIINDVHSYKAGLSYQYDNIEELTKVGIFNRSESVPGAFFEYSYIVENLSIVPGIRYDQHSNYGGFVTPRLHMKYNPSEKSVVRLSAGRGLRTANIFAENMGIFSSNRVITIDSEDNGNPYGLDAEVSWNYGISYTQGIDIGEKELTLSTDFYRTSFENQVVIDFETPTRLGIYNLDGKSYSNSYQVKAEYEVISNLDVRLAYRYYDVKTTYSGELKTKPLVASHRAFINSSFTTDNGWMLDATFNWRGPQRLADTSSNPPEYQRPDEAPSYFLLNTQISKSWNDVFEIYLGAENLLNYRQDDAIIAADDAFGPYFDATQVWAPLFGRNIYIGFRYNFVKE